MKVVLDTNVFVAAGFNPRSASAGLVSAVRRGGLVMPWHRFTWAETRRVVRQIPRLSWGRVAGLFGPVAEYRGRLDEGQFRQVEDPADRKFAALAAATGAVLVTNDDHLLSQRGWLGTQGVRVVTSGAFQRSLAGKADKESRNTV